jgi:alkylhydroperoxidase family enzyme
VTIMGEAALSAWQQKLYDDLADDGYVWDLTRAWAHHQETKDQLVRLIEATADAPRLTPRDKAVIALAQAAAARDSDRAGARGERPTHRADIQTAIAALTASGTPFNEREQALAAWARTIAPSPGSSTPQDIQRLHDAGFQEPQIVALTVYAGLSMALSSIDSALGARPDIALAATVDPAVRTAVV